MSITIQGVTKRYGEVIALRTCSLEVNTGELLCLVGPSGCGKSTLLRIVAGFLEADEGVVRISGRYVNGLPVRERNIAFVMERLGLYPHLSVFENVAYPLRVRGVSGIDIKKRVLAICELTGIAGLENRMPSQLSGGQRQRVAVARALVRDDATVLLADECFSDLDAQLKYQLRGEFRRWQKSRGLTSIFVTHDQEEALALGDRIALMNMGSIEQIGVPDEVYGDPRTIFAAGFLGRPASNLVPFRNESGILTAFGQRFLESNKTPFSGVSESELVLGFRPEDVKIVVDEARGIQATVEWVELMSPDILVHLTVNNLRVTGRLRSTQRVSAGALVMIDIEKSKWHIFDRRTGDRVQIGGRG